MKRQHGSTVKCLEGSSEDWVKGEATGNREASDNASEIKSAREKPRRDKGKTHDLKSRRR